MNPYREWLQIASDGSPNYYELLGLRNFEVRQSLIEQQFNQQYEKVRKYQVGRYEDLANPLLDELSTACHCLTDPQKKAAYDLELRKSLGEKPLPEHLTVTDKPSGHETVADQELPPKITSVGTPKQAEIKRAKDSTSTTVRSRDARLSANRAGNELQTAIPERGGSWSADLLGKLPTKSRQQYVWTLASIAMFAVLLIGVALFASFRTNQKVGQSVAWRGVLSKIAIHEQPSAPSVARLLISDVASARDEKRSADAPLFVEAFTRDAALIRRLGLLTSGDESRMGPDRVAIEGTLCDPAQKSLPGSRLLDGSPLVEIASISKVGVGLTLRAGSDEANGPALSDDNLKLTEALRTVGRRTVLTGTDCEFLADFTHAPNADLPLTFWNVRVAGHHFVVSFLAESDAKRSAEFQAGMVSIEVEPAGSSRVANAAELIGRLRAPAEGSEVSWTGLLSKVIATPPPSPSAGVVLSVSDKSGSRDLFKATTTDFAFALELADFLAVAEVGDRGDLVTVVGRLTSRGGQQEGAAQLALSSIKRHRDGLVAAVGRSRERPFALTAEDVDLATKLRTKGARVRFAASIASGADPLVRVDRLQRDYRIHISNPKAYSTARRFCIEATFEGDWDFAIRNGVRQEAPILKGTVIGPTFAELLKHPDPEQKEAVRYPLVVTRTTVASGLTSIHIRVADIEGPHDVVFSTRTADALNSFLAKLRHGEELEGDFLVARRSQGLQHRVPTKEIPGKAALVLAVEGVMRPGRPETYFDFRSSGQPVERTAAVGKTIKASLAPAGFRIGKPEFVLPEKRLLAKSLADIGKKRSNHVDASLELKWAPLGTMLGISGGDGDLTIRGPESLNRPGILRRGLDSQPVDIWWSPDSQFFATTPRYRHGIGAADCDMSIFWASGGEYPLTTLGSVNPASHAVWAPDGKSFFVVKADGSVECHKVASLGNTGGLSNEPDNRIVGAKIWAAAVKPDGRQLATIESEGKGLLSIAIRNLPGGKVVSWRSLFGSPSDAKMIPIALWWSVDGASQKLIMRQGERLTFWKWGTATDPELSSLYTLDIGASISFSENWAWVASSDGETNRPVDFPYRTSRIGNSPILRINVHALGYQTPIGQLSGKGILGFAMSPDGKRLAVVTAESGITIVSTAKLEPEVTIQPPNPAVALDWNPDSRRLATAHNDGSVRIWECPSIP